jgi:preprotein translocase subunit SecD
LSKNGLTTIARKRLGWLGFINVVFVAIIAFGVAFGGANKATWVPKLGLDLQGGTQIILSPVLQSGEKISTETMNQAVSIIRQRVDGTGVSESQINTSGNNNIVVSIPGTPSDSTLALIRSSATLDFRPVILASSGAASSVGGDTGKTSTATPTAAAPVATSSAKPTDGSDLNWVSKELLAKYTALDCSTFARAPGEVDDPTKPVVTCDDTKTEKYILGPIEVHGTNIANAVATTKTTSTGASTNEWVISLDFDATGTKDFGGVTSRLFPLADPRNRFAVTLDGYVITAPATRAVISNGSAEISGNFTKASAQSLADQLKFGSLPISFEVQSQENISATLGTEQLSSGLIAGGIGLLLVIVYSVFQYRGLAIVTIGSLAVAALLVYLSIDILSWRQGYRLSLAGVAGLIVSIGITADSFIVYFERVRDELRDGRTLSAAVEAGWKRAVRTIIVSDGVSLLAATVLYVLTVGNVKGFAFTLGLTTLIDLLVVTLFTHPMLQILAQTKFFSSGSSWSGFDSKALAITNVIARRNFEKSDSVPEGKIAKSSKEAVKRQTLAERKAQEAEAAAVSAPKSEEQN